MSKEYKAQWAKENRERANERRRKWRAEHKAEHKARNKAWYATVDKEVHRHRARVSHLKTKYGLTLEEYDSMVIAQEGRCAICNKEEPNGRNLHVDHNHKTGRIRKLLCKRCNAALGLVDESPQILSAMKDYLLENEELTQ